MAYTKTTWKDRVVQFANRFLKSNETSTSVDLTANPGVVTEAGTPLNATNLNKIEQGIADAAASADAAKAATDAATNAATANTIAKRDGSGRMKAAAPSASDDVARKNETDAVQTNLNNHANDTTAPVHGSSTSATANTLAHRDGNGDLTGRQLKSSVATGTAPLSVASSTLVSTLNVDQVDGIHFRMSNGFLEYYDGSTWKGAGGVKAVQRGTATIGPSNDVNITISAVNMNKTFVNILWGGNGSTSSAVFWDAKLTSSTNLYIHGTNGHDFNWEVIEFY